MRTLCATRSPSFRATRRNWGATSRGSAKSLITATKKRIGRTPKTPWSARSTQRHLVKPRGPPACARAGKGLLRRIPTSQRKNPFANASLKPDEYAFDRLPQQRVGEVPKAAAIPKKPSDAKGPPRFLLRRWRDGLRRRFLQLLLKQPFPFAVCCNNDAHSYN